MRELSHPPYPETEPLSDVDRQQYIVGLLTAFLDSTDYQDVSDEFLALNEDPV